MHTLLPLVTVGIACLALAFGLWQVGRKLKDLEMASRTVAEAGPPGRARASGSRPMLSALYQDKEPSPLQAVSGLPGGRWVIAALVLVPVAVFLSATTRSPAPAAPSTPDSAITQLRQRVDSLALGMGTLRDSLRMISSAKAPPKLERAPTSRIAGRAAAPETGILPAAPPPPVGSAP